MLGNSVVTRLSLSLKEIPKADLISRLEEEDPRAQDSYTQKTTEGTSLGMCLVTIEEIKLTFQPLFLQPSAAIRHKVCWIHWQDSQLNRSPYFLSAALECTRKWPPKRPSLATSPDPGNASFLASLMGINPFHVRSSYFPNAFNFAEHIVFMKSHSIHNSCFSVTHPYLPLSCLLGGTDKNSQVIESATCDLV